MMRHNQATRLIGILTALVLAACVGGARDNEVVVSGGGIGGTGVTTWEGGIGGTGVVGTITGFGSIIVNGLHIQYNVNQPVESVVGPMNGASFAIGQVVAAQTQLQNGRLVAVRLIVQTSLIGPVESINLATGEMRVLGETVHVMANAELGMANLANVNVGDMVVVSGHRGEDGVYASRIDPAPAGVETGLSGTVTAKTNGGVVIDNRHQVRVTAAEHARIAVGDYVSVSGLAPSFNGQFAARVATRSYGPMFDGRVARMAVEGVFGRNPYGVPGVGPVTGVPTGRSVVFVSKDLHGQMVLNGAIQRPTESWRENLSIKTPGLDSFGNGNTSGSRSGYSGRSGGGSGGGGSGGGGSGGGGSSGSGSGGSGNGGGR